MLLQTGSGVRGNSLAKAPAATRRPAGKRRTISCVAICIALGSESLHKCCETPAIEWRVFRNKGQNMHAGALSQLCCNAAFTAFELALKTVIAVLHRGSFTSHGWQQQWQTPVHLSTDTHRKHRCRWPCRQNLTEQTISTGSGRSEVQISSSERPPQPRADACNRPAAHRMQTSLAVHHSSGLAPRQPLELASSVFRPPRVHRAAGRPVAASIVCAYGRPAPPCSASIDFHTGSRSSLGAAGLTSNHHSRGWSGAQQRIVRGGAVAASDDDDSAALRVYSSSGALFLQGIPLRRTERVRNVMSHTLCRMSVAQRWSDVCESTADVCRLQL